MGGTGHEDEIAGEIIDVKNKPRTYAELLEYGAGYGYDKESIGTLLKAAGFKSFKVDNWDGMCRAIKETAETTNEG